MNKFLKSAVERYPKKEEERKIHPISNIDGEIITELIEIFKKHEINEVKGILDKYKYLSDEDIRDLLLEYNTNNPEKPKDKDLEKLREKEGSGNASSEQMLRELIDFDGEILELWSIKRITKERTYNYKENKLEYGICINKDLPENFLLKDITIKYNEEEERDSRLDKLKKEILSKGVSIIGLSDSNDNMDE